MSPKVKSTKKKLIETTVQPHFLKTGKCRVKPEVIIPVYLLLSVYVISFFILNIQTVRES